MVMSGVNRLVLNIKDMMGTDILGSRDQGRLLRSVLMEKISANEPVRLDFHDVDIMTSAFADECFAKLWRKVPHERIRKLVHITGFSPNNKAVFRFVLAEEQ